MEFSGNSLRYFCLTTMNKGIEFILKSKHTIMTIILTIAILAAFSITYFVIPSIIDVAQVKQLFDVPGERKTHARPIPALGGISFFVSFWAVIFALAATSFVSDLRYLFIGSLILLVIGIKDDLVEVGPKAKFFWQVVTGSVLFFAGFRVEGLHGLFGIQEISVAFSYILTLLTFVFLINAYNLIDGINGLAGSLGLVAVAGFGVIFYNTGAMNLCLISAVMAGVLVGFLKYNIGKAVIFMGDNGSTFLGMIIAVLFIECINTDFSSSSISPILLALGLVIIPVFDTIRIFMYRILKGQSPFTADRKHLHHVLQDMGKTHIWVVSVTLIANLLILVWIIEFSSNTSIFLTLASIGFFLLSLICFARFSQSLTEIKSMEYKRHQAGFYE